ncbi:uncharacterized protein LOC125369456 isoform X2 [Ricinus communis]|uniref:uncharacterized protein LOC125369456 isoform X2 n=1 Tax=Ricinus communis TaxID=3988 RepID=UPI00201ADECF|nr:uncharacterized protein LOC125369456 isoform X2 [Ricinus communis]XP_048227853.1 uncharacterized protein LOC125369456 isoform X2 [Ricinus communis]
MARGLILSSQSRVSLVPFLPPKCQKFMTRFFSCKSSSQIDMDKYREAFSHRMAMAGLKPQHRIAIGVSGGPDSVALCVLTAAWKSAGVAKSEGFVDGLLAIVVDHGLRPESKEEAQVVSRRVSDMGVRCEIACCSWYRGRPKQGHLQEEARDMSISTRIISTSPGLQIPKVTQHLPSTSDWCVTNCTSCR